jgi:hypothetical protein
MVWVVFILSLPIYALWVVLNALWVALLAVLDVLDYNFLCSCEAKFCDFVDKVIIQKQWRQRKKK